MRFALLAATALSTTLTALVSGATPGLAAPAVVPFDWSGFYVGANVGLAHQSARGTAAYPDGITTDPNYSFSANDLYIDGSVTDTGLPTIFNLDGNGAGVGVEAGYNLTAGTVVYGVEGDFRLLNLSTSATGTSAGGLTTVKLDSTLNSLATLRARVGVSADRLLLFTTAGLAVGQSSLSTSFNYVDTGKGAALTGNGSGLGIGYAFGGGAEYAISDKITLKGEALYYNLGRMSVTANDNGSTHNTGGGSGPATVTPYTASVDRGGVLISTGLNFKF